MKTLVNQNVIAELKNGFCFVRDQKNHGIITAIVSERKTKKVLNVLDNCDSLTFSQIWDKMNLIKGVNFEYRSY